MPELLEQEPLDNELELGADELLELDEEELELDEDELLELEGEELELDEELLDDDTLPILSRNRFGPLLDRPHPIVSAADEKGNAAPSRRAAAALQSSLSLSLSDQIRRVSIAIGIACRRMRGPAACAALFRAA